MTRAIYPATFDPITNGHVDIAERAARIFSELVVGVFDRPTKNLLFSTEERLEMTRQVLAHLKNVHVKSYSGLTVNFAKEQEAQVMVRGLLFGKIYSQPAVNFAKEQEAQVMVRGLRALSDFEWELQLSLTNHSLEPDVETVCLMASQEHSFLSSSILKEIAANGGNVEHLAPPIVVEALNKNMMVDESL